MTEAQFQTRFSRWLKSRFGRTGAFELKLCKGSSMPFDVVAPHQIANLNLAKTGFMTYKIPDDTISQKPYDCFSLSGVPAYVVIMFWKPRVKHFYMIGIECFINEMEVSDRKSLTEERATEIGTRCSFD